MPVDKKKLKQLKKRERMMKYGKFYATIKKIKKYLKSVL